VDNQAIVRSLNDIGNMLLSRDRHMPDSRKRNLDLVDDLYRARRYEDACREPALMQENCNILYSSIYPYDI
jgi:hypothetical protein